MEVFVETCFARDNLSLLNLDYDFAIKNLFKLRSISSFLAQYLTILTPECYQPDSLSGILKEF